MSLDPRSPSMNLWHWLLGHGASEDEATKLMNSYAHELAERQREHADSLECYNGALFDAGQLHSLPDLIDSTVQQPPVDEYRLSTRPGVVGGRE